MLSTLKELVELVRERIGPVAAFKLAMVVKRLPKTRSGKILRGTMKRIAGRTEYEMPSGFSAAPWRDASRGLDRRAAAAFS
jgi:hypothetical protein